MEPSIDNITASLQKHAQIFDDLLRLIPPKFYLPEDNEQNGSTRYMKNTKKEASGKQKDAQRKARANAKAARLDPDKNKTVQEIQAEKLEKQNVNKTDSIPGSKVKLAHVNGTIEGSDGREQEQDLNMDKMDIDLDVEGTSTTNSQQVGDIKPMAGSASIGELRQRLQTRIQNLRQKRKAPEDDMSREALLEKRMKRRKSTKEAKAKARQAGNTAREQVLGNKTPSAHNGSETEAEGSSTVKDNIFFGRLTTGMIKKKKSFNVKQQLAKVENKKKEIAELRKADSTKAEKIEEKDKWNKALDLAKGEKVKDDSKLLRKTIRRNEQQKKKSSREWGERKEQVADKLKERTTKRETNIQIRIDAKKMKKQGKSKAAIQRTLQAKKTAGSGKSGKPSGKPGKARPGFEGKAPRK
ncbi:SURF6-domain-containing protein [Coemansia reversa NRRL 1564]|uniref:SURF6-domain-containing protein n=1 Tax=Coemansia reversa (strain ATCC 12441 / NRRL 1564) TaxID=763665 RepID=A0A2G5BD40_COERN|nr:SURF6-domain-containing protein [Coemansia reversa NRRL 1564]|eukprot:PIA16902.1 SURF6-domain-containing protein [Coemansia reversa NRRL 1564]